MLLSYFVGQKHYPIDYPLKDIALYTLCAAVLFVLMQLTPRLGSRIATLAANTALIGLFCALIVMRDFPLSRLPVIGKYFRKGAGA